MANFKRPTTVDLINNGKYANAAAGTIIKTLGFTTKGIGGADWRKTGVTGLTPSQTPAQRGTGKLNDALGHEWELVAKYPVNIQELGAAVDDSTDDYLPIQAAFNAYRHVYNPGVARSSAEIIINTSGTKADGGGYRSSEYKFTGANSNGFVIRDDNWDTTSTGVYLNDVEISNLRISRSAASTSGSGVLMRVVSEPSLRNVKIVEFPFCLEMQGCINSRHSNLRLFAGSVITSPVANSAFLKITPAIMQDSSKVAGFTHNFTNFFFGGLFSNQVITSCVHIEGGEVGWFSNGYMGAVSGQHVLGSQLANSVNMNNYSFDTVYFDGVSSGSGTTAVTLKDNAFTGGTANNWSFENCSFGQLQRGFNVTHGTVNGLRVDGKFFNIEKEAFISTSDIDVEIGGVFTNILSTPAGSTAALDIADANIVKIDATFDNTNSGTAIKISGTTDTLSVSPETVYKAVGTDLSVSGTVNNFISGSGTFTPTISFGGGSTGVTYSTQTGRFTVNGNLLQLSVFMVLTSKGTDVGDVGIGGVPFTTQALPQSLAFYAGGLVSGTGDVHLSAFIPGSGSEIRPQKSSGSGNTRLADTDLLNTFNCVITGSVLV